MKIPSFGENVYKQVTVNGTKVNKWVQLVQIKKFDDNGNSIYKNVNGNEIWTEYDTHNNMTLERTSEGDVKTWKRKYDSSGNNIWFKREWSEYECWLDYDENGNKIHSKNSDYEESWMEYNENNQLTHVKKDNGYELWCEFDEKGILIHTSDSDGNESWFDNDENGKCIHIKESNGDETHIEYDENGHTIHRINPDGSDVWFELELYENEKIKTVLSFRSI